MMHWYEEFSEFPETNVPDVRSSQLCLILNLEEHVPTLGQTLKNP